MLGIVSSGLGRSGGVLWAKEQSVPRRHRPCWKKKHGAFLVDEARRVGLRRRGAEGGGGAVRVGLVAWGGAGVGVERGGGVGGVPRFAGHCSMSWARVASVGPGIRSSSSSRTSVISMSTSSRGNVATEGKSAGVDRRGAA